MAEVWPAATRSKRVRTLLAQITCTRSVEGIKFAVSAEPAATVVTPFGGMYISFCCRLPSRHKNMRVIIDRVTITPSAWIIRVSKLQDIIINDNIVNDA
ncbi:hypothetical protein KCP75_23445 [Salmonella enterica subsp. enterica]|nr:hypothetical protein KCP75_23445 [Salmonella enterica subsp. enterica]